MSEVYLSNLTGNFYKSVEHSFFNSIINVFNIHFLIMLSHTNRICETGHQMHSISLQKLLQKLGRMNYAHSSEICILVH